MAHISIIHKALFALMLLVLISSCGDGINLENRDNELIPNYSITLTNSSLSNSMTSDIIAVNDNKFVSALEDLSSNITLVELTQQYTNENWELQSESILNIGSGKLTFFNSLQDEYLVGFTQSDGSTALQVIDENFNLSTINDDLETFIDTFYNEIDSVHLSNFTYVEESDQILLGGEVYTQGTTFSCLLNLDRDLNPIWIKTYFEDSNIADVVSINRDTFYVISNSAEDGADLIRDNQNSLAYSKYDLSNYQLFFGSQSFVDEERLFLTGIHNDIGRTIEVNINNNSTFINEVEIYKVTDLRAVFLSRDNIVTAGIQIENGTEHQFSSELESVGSIWCHKYIDETYHKILDIIEMPGKGILISSIVEQDGDFFIHLTRIDEEGATFVNEYTENCI